MYELYRLMLECFIEFFMLSCIIVFCIFALECVICWLFKIEPYKNDWWK